MSFNIKTNQGLQRINSPTQVNISNSIIDSSYLPESDKTKIISSAPIIESNIYSIGGRYYTPLSEVNTSVTLYAIVKTTAGSQTHDETILVCVPYSNTNGNSPSFYCADYSSNVEATICSGNTTISGITCTDYHIYSMSINNSTKKVRYFVDGVYQMEKTFTNSGSNVVVGAGDKNGTSYCGRVVSCKYLGVISECEDDATIIANHQNIMQKFNMT